MMGTLKELFDVLYDERRKEELLNYIRKLNLKPASFYLNCQIEVHIVD